MKTSLPLIVLFGAATVLAGCGDSDSSSPSNTAGSSSAGEAGEGTAGKAGAASGGGSGASAGSAGEGTAGSGDAGMPAVGGDGPGDAGAGGEGGADNTTQWYQCQASDQAWVRRAILGTLGRRAYGQAEVNAYADIITQVDAMDGYDPSEKVTAPIIKLRHARQVALEAMLQSPEYLSNWGELYRDFVRVQRIDELQNAGCSGLRVRTTDAKAVAAWVRDNPPDIGSDGKAAPTFADVVFGSVELDDVTPIYTENLFTMVVRTYAGANATPVALELSRRADFGAWFDGMYLNRDMVCLGCHNSEFSVTQSDDPATNRHYPVPGLFEKALFGDSVGPALVNGFAGADRLHGAMRRAQFLNDCGTASNAQITAATAAGTLPTCASGDTLQFCTSAGTVMCRSVASRERMVQPWGIASACGAFIPPQNVPIDQAGVETRLGNVTGLRTSMWDVATSLRAGFNKLEVEGLGADADGNIADADKALSYLVSMNIVERVWREIVGTPLTISNYFPRNAASRDQLVTLTEAFIKSGYSNKALIKEIFASPYLNMAAPEAACETNPYGAPRIFDPWRTAEPDPAFQGNSISDGVQPASARTAARAAYAALGWPLAAYGQVLPNVSGWGENSVTVGGLASGTLELQFQTETGTPLKNSQPGFRGLDFQARLGWEDRFAQCQKLPTNTTADFIDGVVAAVKPETTVTDVITALKDRIMGESAIAEAEKTVLTNMVGASLTAPASSVADLNGSLRRVCGVMISSPQFLMLGVEAKDGDTVPAAVPPAFSYDAFCTKLAGVTLPDDLSITCTSGSALTVNVKPQQP